MKHGENNMFIKIVIALIALSAFNSEALPKDWCKTHICAVQK